MTDKSPKKLNQLLITCIILIIGVVIGFGITNFSKKSEALVVIPVTEPEKTKVEQSPAKNRQVTALENKIKHLDSTIDKLMARNTELQNTLISIQDTEEPKESPQQAALPEVETTPTNIQSTPTFNLQGELTDAWIEKSDMNSDDAERVRDILTQQHNDIKALELANTEVKYASDNEFIITVTPFPEDAAKIRSNLITDLENVLHEDDMVELRQSINNPIRRSPYSLGKLRRDINIRIEHSADGDPTYVIKESSGNNEAKSSSSWSMSSSRSSSSETPSMSVMTSSGGFSSFNMTSRTKELPEAYRHFLPEN